MEEEMSGAAAELAVTPATETPEAPRRGRGRPRKPQQEPVDPSAPKRPRGRPKGSKNKASRNKPKEPPKEKRPRGRPRKWVRPQKAAQQQQQETEEDEDQPHLPSPQEKCI